MTAWLTGRESGMTGEDAAGSTGGYRMSRYEGNGTTDGKGIGDSRYEEVEKQTGRDAGAEDAPR